MTLISEHRTLTATTPKLFRIAEIESSRAGKVGMEVGSLGERVIVALCFTNYEVPVLNRVFFVQLNFSFLYGVVIIRKI
jgi:hypothetical protein